MRIVISRRNGAPSQPPKDNPAIVDLGIIAFLGPLLGVIVVAAMNFSPILLPGIVVVIFTFFLSALLMLARPYLFSLYSIRIPGIFSFSYFIFIILPLPFIYLEFAGRPSSLIYLILTAAGYFFSLLGIVFMDRLFPITNHQIQTWYRRPIRWNRMLLLSGLVLLIICVILLFLYISQVGDLPIAKALRGGYDKLALAEAREYALKLIEGRIVYLFTLLRNALFPYVMLLFFLAALTISGNKWKLIFLTALVGNFIIATATLEKSPAMAGVVMLAFCYFLARGKVFSPTPKTLVFLFLLSFAFPILVYALVGYAAYPEEIVHNLFRRLFILPNQVLFNYFDYFPNAVPFLNGRGLPYISKLFHEGPFPVANSICLYMYPDNPIKSCLANGAYVGFLWADFGWGGVFVGSFLVGIVLQGLQIFIMRLPKFAPVIVLQSMFAFFVVYLTSTTIMDLIDPLGRGFIIVLTIVLIALSTGPVVVKSSQTIPPVSSQS